ncbi:low-density lipoprotein receptor-related protein 2-like [Hydractinia symbiolongicarpus]|uniref:low-density lipoprotein receptor-related protein 2-like n=1 Tax=Hydractinia symbiolongicarpus TaxID=13093 RepID=UPI00254BF4FC|nr:low-density lipoprotein receptor-related protein 2-like [Hydractinia symbiolongicarpus]
MIVYRVTIFMFYVYTFHAGNVQRCRTGQFQCGVDMKCIPDYWRCDSERDCLDGTDENECQQIRSSCFDPIGIANVNVIQKNDFLSSSIRHDKDSNLSYNPYNARLNQITTTLDAGGWCADRSMSDTHWIQVNLGEPYIITKVAIQSEFFPNEFCLF